MCSRSSEHSSTELVYHSSFDVVAYFSMEITAAGNNAIVEVCGSAPRLLTRAGAASTSLPSLSNLGFGWPGSPFCADCRSAARFTQHENSYRYLQPHLPYPQLHAIYWLHLG